MNSVEWIKTIWHDLKHTLRALRKNKLFSAAIVLTLTLGIGTNTAIFSLANAVLLKPIRAPEPDRVVVFTSTSKSASNAAASEAKFNLWREQTDLFEEISASYTLGSLNLTGVDEPQRAHPIFVTQNYFRLFGLPIAKGRSFTAEEERPNGPNVVILSSTFWKRAFSANPRIIGQPISLGGKSYEVVGIMADGVEPENIVPPDVWLPFAIDPNSDNQGHYFQVLARLKPNVSFALANAKLKLVAEQFRRKYPNSLPASRGEIFQAEPMQGILVKDIRSSLIILIAAVSLVLFIASTNAASLLLIRATSRKREMAIRAAIGASRGRIIRQLLTESLFLSFVSGLFGLVLGFAGIRSFIRLYPSNIPRVGPEGANITLDWNVLLFTTLIATATGVLFGLIPAFQGSRTSLSSSLKESSGHTGTGFRQNKVRSLLVIGEISLAFVLLIGASLLTRTLIALRAVDPGFDAQGVVTTQTPLNPESAHTSRVNDIIDNAIKRLGSLPGVESVGFTRLVPLDGDFNSIPIVVVGRPLDGPAHGASRWMVVSSSYFDVLKIPLIRGRSFTDSDRNGSPGVAIINQSMARQMWGASDPIGSQILIGKGLGPNFEEPPRQIIGIARDVHDDGLGKPSQPAVFIPGAQLPDSRTSGRTISWLVRTHIPSRSLDSAIQGELRQATGEPVAPIRSMREVIAQSTARQRFNMLMMNIFGMFALLLAAVGIYALMSYSVQQRTQEMGIRMALGAKPKDVRNMVVWQAFRLVIAGIAVGSLGAAGLTRFLAGVLFGVKPLDPFVFIFVPCILCAIAVVAVWLPARHASRVDPIQALKA